MAASTLSSCITTGAALARATPSRRQAAARVVIASAASSSDSAEVRINRRQVFGIGAAIAATAATPKAAQAAFFELDVPGPYPPEYIPETQTLLDSMQGMLDGSNINVKKFQELSKAWEAKYKFHHYGQDSSYLLTLKAELAMNGTAGGWSAAKGYYSGDEPFDPTHTNYKPEVMERYVAQAGEYLRGERDGLQPDA